jgi:hypothetical protein
MSPEFVVVWSFEDSESSNCSENYNINRQMITVQDCSKLLQHASAGLGDERKLGEHTIDFKA